WVAFLLLSDIDAERWIFFEDLGGIEEFLQSFSNSKRARGELYQRLLGKFDEQIKSLKALYIAPDGLLNLISFATLIHPGGDYLVKQLRISRLQTGRDLLTPVPDRTPNLLVAFGGVKYGDLPSLDNGDGALPAKERAARLNRRAGKELEGFIHMEQSLFEVEGVTGVFKTARDDGEVFVFKGREAVEAQFRNASRPPGLLHLSTSAFYLENMGPGRLAPPGTPFLLSGVALAGANPGLEGRVDEQGDDGLLYSREILGLNLQGAELVSISVGDAGKGDFDYSQGFTGLVRAFRAAGVQSVLLPSGPAESPTSRAFMEKFYENLLTPESGPTPAEALHQTRLYYINHPEEAQRDPKVWALYVLYGKL
ncbi:MAG: CHAT domain-containing protein, partial [Desulfobacterales bacterium]|nr:CHAT domain-containing protein [Desulfobacterales bacterium]